MKVNISIKNSNDPKSCILAIEAVTREICQYTGRDPAEGTMMLLTAAAHLMNTYSPRPIKEQAVALTNTLVDALLAADGFFTLRSVAKQADNMNEPSHD